MYDRAFRVSRRTVLARLSAGLTICTLPGRARAADGVLHVEDFRSLGASDRETIQRALDELKGCGAGSLEFDAGRTYRLGPITSPNAIFQLRDFHDVELRGNGASLICETVGPGRTYMFFLQRCFNLHIRDFEASDIGTNLLGTSLRQKWKGMNFVHLETTGGPSEGIALSSLTVDRAVSLFACSGRADSPRARRITLTDLVARNCYYGLNFQENGDDVVGDLRSVDCRRTYFPYGVSNHWIILDVHHSGVGPGANACILIKRYGRDTRDIAVSARFSGVLAWRNLVALEQQPPAGEVGLIENIDVALDVNQLASDPYRAARLGFSSIRQDKPVARSVDVWRNIRLSGCFAADGRSPIVYHARSPNMTGITLEDSGDCR